MTFDDLIFNFEYWDIQIDVSSLQHSYYGFYGDDTPYYRSAIFIDYDDEYNVHTIIVSSAVSQTVRISAYTYYEKQYHGDCWNDGAGDTFVYLYDPTDGKVKEVSPGAYHISEISMTAGEEVKIHMFTTFEADNYLPHDWSVTAWA